MPQGFRLVIQLIHEADGGSPMVHTVDKNILHTIKMNLTRETAEVLMIELAEFMGFGVVVKNDE